MQEMKTEIRFSELLTVGVTLVVVGLVFVFGTDITVDTRNDFLPTCPNQSGAGVTGSSFAWNDANLTCINTSPAGGTNLTSDLYNASGAYINANNTIQAMGKVPDKLPIIAIVIAVSVIITILVRSFMKLR